MQIGGKSTNSGTREKQTKVRIYLNQNHHTIKYSSNASEKFIKNMVEKAKTKSENNAKTKMRAQGQKC